jgi:hypothetical protein
MEKQNIKTKIELQRWPGPSGELFEVTEKADETKETDEAEQPNRQLPQLVRNALDAFEAGLKDANLKPTLAEYLKLLQFEREVSEEEQNPREITVTWVEPELDYSEE